MSTFRNPVGSQSRRVYWRRRLAVLIGLIVVVGVIVFLIVRPGAGDTANAPEASPTGTPAASEPAASPSDELETPIEGAVCDPSVVTVEAITDDNAYAEGELPQLSFRVTNTSGAGCTYNLGSTQQTFVITSGEEQYWSSKDCEVESVDAEMLLEPNVAETSSPISWDRARSSADTCDIPGEPVPAGGATYALTVTVGEVESEPLSFLLN